MSARVESSRRARVTGPVRPPAAVVGVAAVALLSFVVTDAAAQGGRTRVGYDVEFSTTGALMTGTGTTCLTAAGTDQLTGTLWGWEPPAANEDNTYKGVLKRDTDITFCYIRYDPRQDQSYNCSVNIKGKADVPVEFDLYFDGRGGYLRAMDTSVTVHLTQVQGSCDPVEMAQWQRDYWTMSTAGSPDGQPIELPAFPRQYPKTFPSNPPQSSWTLTVLGRRP